VWIGAAPTLLNIPAGASIAAACRAEGKTQRMFALARNITRVFGKGRRAIRRLAFTTTMLGVLDESCESERALAKLAGVTHRTAAVNIAEVAATGLPLPPGYWIREPEWAELRRKLTQQVLDFDVELLWSWVSKLKVIDEAAEEIDEHDEAVKFVSVTQVYVAYRLTHRGRSNGMIAKALKDLRTGVKMGHEGIQLLIEQAEEELFK
jgi:hypothetical protein